LQEYVNLQQMGSDPDFSEFTRLAPIFP
jgi:hypothetical protein